MGRPGSLTSGPRRFQPIFSFRQEQAWNHAHRSAEVVGRQEVVVSALHCQQAGRWVFETVCRQPLYSPPFCAGSAKNSVVRMQYKK